MFENRTRTNITSNFPNSENPNSQTTMTYASANQTFSSKERKSRIAGCLITVLFTAFIVMMFYCILTSDPISGRREPEFRVESGVLSSWNLSGGAVLTATWDFTLVAINLNDNFDIYFYDIHDLESNIYEELLRISILRSGEKEYYRRHLHAFATAWLGPLSLGKRSDTRVNITLPVVREYVGDAVATQISSEEKARGSVNFTLVMEGQYKYSNTSSWYSPLFCSVFHEVDFRVLPDNNETEIQRGMPASGVSSEVK